MVIFYLIKYGKNIILSQEDLDDAIYSSKDGKIYCCIENINDDNDNTFTIGIYAGDYLIDDIIMDVIFHNELMDSDIGKAIKDGKLYMID